MCFRKWLRAAWALLACFSILMPVTSAGADAYPAKPIRLVVPFAAAGTSDVISRIMGQRLAERWNVAVVVENRAGAGGNIGSEVVAQSAPDGYTMLLGTVATHGINASLYKKLSFDPVRDFAPISLLASTPSVLMVNAALPVHSVQELIAYARANPGKLYFGSSGNGSSHHLAGELFNSMAGVKITHVPYRGTAAAQTDLMAGQIQVIFDTLPSAMPFIKSDKLRALAVTSTQRDPALPDLPTISEAGLPGYEVGSWYGLLFPAGVDPEIVKRANEEVVAVVRSPEVTQKFLELGATPVASTPEAFADFIRKELEKWAPVIKASGAIVD